MKKRTLKQLRLWLKENGYGDCKVKNGKEFEYDYNTSTIHCGDYKDIIDAEPTFVALCKRYGLKEYDMATMTILHELGHHNTGYNTSAISDLIDRALRRLVNIMPCYNKFEQVLCYWFYQRIPQEKMATKWACQFVIDNPQATEQLKAILQGD